jgi:hypothetical protein
VLEGRISNMVKALGMEASVDLNEGRRGKVVLAQVILILTKKEVNIKYIFIFFYISFQDPRLHFKHQVINPYQYQI